MQKKLYVPLEVEVIEFENDSVNTTSISGQKPITGPVVPIG